jgi:hypothetical protein
MRHSPEYAIWKSMKGRCYIESNTSYDRYGGRGITVSDEWRGSFIAFYRDMGPRPNVRHSIERLDNNGPYSRENCIWATDDIQRRNKRKPMTVLKLKGVEMTMADWARGLNVDYRLLWRRKQDGWSDEAALTGQTSPGFRLPYRQANQNPQKPQ